MPPIDGRPLSPPRPEDFPGLEGLRLSPGRAESLEGAVAWLERGPKGFWSLNHSQNGRSIRLSSAVDPKAEDRSLLARLKLSPGQGLICPGLGLASHLEELAGRLDPETPLWVLESRPELAACALMAHDFSGLLARPGFRLFIGPFDGPPWGEAEEAPTEVLWRPATARHFAGEYPLTPPLPAKRPTSGRRLLLFQSGYFLDRELKNAAEALDLPLATWQFQRGAQGDGGNFKELLELIKKFRPDLVLTVNHLGFDAEGVMDDLFTRLGLPVASWFVDSPPFILGRIKAGPALRAFSWDSDYIPQLRRAFAQVDYLPLATDEHFFHPAPPAPPARNLAFVGDSLTAATAKYLAKLGFQATDPAVPELLRAADRLAEKFLAGPDLLPDEAALETLARAFISEASEEKILDLGALITWRASRLWRRQVLSALPPNDLTVAGDEHWAGLLGLASDHLLAPLDYYRELPAFYRGSRVNLNITSAQMKSGLNQRIFDVPASGGFLLTDYRAQLENFFEPGREVIAYHSPEEARDLALWYARHPQAREEIIQAAQRRITGAHLYRHRLQEILKRIS